MKYLKLYKKWMTEGVLPGDSGLCKAFRSISKDGSTDKLFTEFYSVNDTFMFWFESKNGHFNETRQNMILFLAAMNNEL